MIFLDSSFIIALEVESDQNHEKAVRLNNEISLGKFGEAIISDYIFDEIITVNFIKTKNLKKTAFVGDKVISALEIGRIDEQTFDSAWEIFKSQEKTKLSFTDCTTLAFMKQNKIEALATFDEDFKKVNGIKAFS